MSIVSGFKGLPRIIQILLLLIPGVNEITEILVRLSAALHGKAAAQILVLILCFPFGIIIGWVDLIWCLLYKRLILI